jgi:hypothetical protein
MAMRTMTADRALPHSQGGEIGRLLTQVGVRLSEFSAARAERRRVARLPDFEPQPRVKVQADIGALVSVAMRLD